MLFFDFGMNFLCFIFDKQKAEHPKCSAFFIPQICQTQKAWLILDIQRNKNQHNDKK
jgi:hypothetical protein